MNLIQPFCGLTPNLKFADEVIAPPYDVLNRQEAKLRAQNKPWSFLHISKPEIDLPDVIDVYSSAVYETGSENFSRMQSNHILQQAPQPQYYLYRLTQGSHQQIGLVATVAVAAYLQHRVRRHEQTQPLKVKDRLQQIKGLNAQTGPVLLTFRSNATITDLISKIITAAPTYNVTADDQVRHELWPIDNDLLIYQISTAFNAIGYLYIADGHHRAEAASQLAQQQPDNIASQYFLAVLFPHNQLQILSYHRVIKDLNGNSVNELLTKLTTVFDLQPANNAVQPQASHQFGMYLAHQWYSLSLRAEKKLSLQGINKLDVSVLADYVLQPLLGITDARRDPRLDFVGGIRGLTELERRVNSGEMAIAFSLFPTAIDDVMATADAGQFMPPKSTWFEPKLADGLVSYSLQSNNIS